MKNKINIKKIFFWIIVFVLFLIIIEIGSFFIYKFYIRKKILLLDPLTSFEMLPNLFEKRTIDSREVLFSKYFPSKYIADENDLRGRYFLLNKHKRVYRIFVYGGSAVAGSPWGYFASFSEFLRYGLKQISKKDVEIEIMNFGVSSFGSRRVAKLIEATINKKPDLIIVYSGHNEIFDNLIHLMMIDNVFIKKYITLTKYSYFFKVLRILQNSIVRLYAEHKEKVTELGYESETYHNFIHSGRLKSFSVELLKDQYDLNIKTIVNIAKKNRVPVILSSQLCNYLHSPQEYNKKVNGLKKYFRLKAHFLSGNYTMVEKEAKKTLNISQDDYAIGNFYLGLVSLKRKRYDNAHRYLIQALDNDLCMTRYSPKLSKILDKYDDPNNEIFFIDTVRYCENKLDDKIMDGRLLFDEVHCNVEGNKMIALCFLNDYFVKNNIRPDFFDYSMFNDNIIWEKNVESQLYFRICKRYFNTDDYKQALNIVRNNYYENGLMSRRRARSYFELLFYAGLLEKKDSYINMAKDIYYSHSMKVLCHKK